MNTTGYVSEEAAQVIEMTPGIVGRPRGTVRPDAEHTCRSCGQRRSRFYYRGAVKADRSHTLCFECFRALVNQLRARRLTAAPDLWPLADPLPGAARLRGDREQWHADMTRRRRQAQMAARCALDGLVGVDAGESRPLQKVS